jgi:hypothetical protein
MHLKRNGPKLLAPITSNKNRQKFDKNLEAMIGATKAQLLKYAIGAMTFKEINPMPLLKMGKTAYQ